MPSRMLTREGTERLVERLMADVVRREQHMTAIREEQHHETKSICTKSKLSRKRLASFLKRVASDVKRRKRSLFELQESLYTDEMRGLTSSAATVRRQQERVGLDGLRNIASRTDLAQALAAVQPNRLVRYLLRSKGVSAKIAPQQETALPCVPARPHRCSNSSSSSSDNGDPRRHQQPSPVRTGCSVSPLTSPRVLAARLAVPDQASALKRSLKLSTATLEFVV